MKVTKGLSYGFLAICLGYVNMPIYVYLPKFYAENFGVSLFWLSILLFGCRIIDTVQDPFIGWISDRSVERGIRRSHIIALSFPLLSVALWCLLLPVETSYLYLWISIFLILVYTFYSFIAINFYTLSAEITQDYNHQTTLVSYREAFALIGISIGSILPSMLLNRYKVEQAHQITWFVFFGLGCLSLAAFYFNSPRAQHRVTSFENVAQAARAVLREKKFLHLLILSLISSIAASLPATLVLFYIQDVLGAKEMYGTFLALYFLCGLTSLPIWYYVSKRTSKKTAWVIGSVVTILSFFSAGFLREGDGLYYGLICVTSGLCLGADLSMPVSILSDLVANHPNKGKYYGVWGMVSKASIAIAGSLGLLVLGWLGYHPGEQVTELERTYVAVTYAFIPCAIKVVGFVLLMMWDIEGTKKEI